MTSRSNRFLNRKRRIIDAEVSHMDMLKHTTVNLVYSFMAGLLPTAVAYGKDWGVVIAALLFYYCLSLILNRPQYTSLLGKYILFPISCTIGFYLGFKFFKIITLYL